MQLKKINPYLQKALVEKGLTEANALQSETFSTIKSGADSVIAASSSSGKTTAIVINVIQRLEKPEGQSPRALVFSESKESVRELTALFAELAQYNGLRIYGVHEKGDIDYDKNQISAGIDVLIGTPARLSEMFSSVGFDVNRLRMFVVDDADTLFKNRMDAKIMRISDSISKVQRIFFCEIVTEKVFTTAEKIMIEPVVFEIA